VSKGLQDLGNSMVPEKNRQDSVDYAFQNRQQSGLGTWITSIVADIPLLCIARCASEVQNFVSLTMYCDFSHMTTIEIICCGV